MALDVYVGSLTRYYCRDWENIVQRWARESGSKYHQVSPTTSSEAVTDPGQIRPAVLAWRSGLEQAIASKLGVKLDWDETPEAPYFTDRPSWEGYGALLLWAAYAERPQRQCPRALPSSFFEDPVLASFGASAQTRFSHLLRGANWWLPCSFESTLDKVGTPAGSSTGMGSAPVFLRQLDALNAATWHANEEAIAGWKKGASADSALEDWAKFGFAIFRDLARKAAENRLPMLLDF